MARILGVRTEVDSVLGAVAPLGLAAAATVTTLVVDLDPAGPEYPGERSLAEVVSEGPRRVELAPSGGRVAILRNGGIEWPAAVATVERLGATWPAIVLRIPVGSAGLPWPVIPVVPLLPGIFTPAHSRPAVWQRTDRGQRTPGPGPVLPPLSRSALTALLEVRHLPARRWVAGWRAVWDLPWP